MARKTYVYVDGFNLYYGQLKGTNLKWLNIEELCKNLLPKNDVVAIKYFTARIKSRPGDPQQANRQQIYFRALRTLPTVSIHYGHFLTNEVMMPTANGRPKFVKVKKTEEKGSDVNIASHILMDAFKREFEVAVVLSNDSDLLTPISMVRQEFRKTVGVINPHKKQSRELLREASFVKSIRKGVVKVSQFPEELTDATGKFRRPKEWG